MVKRQKIHLFSVCHNGGLSINASVKSRIINACSQVKDERRFEVRNF